MSTLAVSLVPAAATEPPILELFWKNPEAGPSPRLVLPASIAAGPAGIVIADPGSGKVVVLSRAGRLLDSLEALSLPGSALSRPTGVAVGPGGRLGVGDESAEEIVVLSSNRQVLARVAVPGGDLRSFAFTPGGDLVVNFPTADRPLVVLGLDGKIRQRFGSVPPEPRMPLATYGQAFLTFDGNGNLYVAYRFLPLVRSYSRDGTMRFEVALNSAIIQALRLRAAELPPAPPLGSEVCVDVEFMNYLAGIVGLPQGGVLVATQNNGEVLRVSSGGKQGQGWRLMHPGEPSYVLTTGIGWDEEGKSLFLLEESMGRVFRWVPQLGG
jgi:hypothetical protein